MCHRARSLALLGRRITLAALATLGLVAVLAACSEGAGAEPTSPAAPRAVLASSPTAAAGGGGGKENPAAALLARTHEVSQTLNIPAGMDDFPLTALCPVGEVATGGGYSISGTPAALLGAHVTESHRVTQTVGADVRSGWRVEFQVGDVSIGGAAYATCVPLQ